jgi:hypothetical protein
MPTECCKARATLDETCAESVLSVIASLQRGMRGPVVPTDLGAEKMLGYMVIIATINSK